MIYILELVQPWGEITFSLFFRAEDCLLCNSHRSSTGRPVAGKEQNVFWSRRGVASSRSGAGLAACFTLFSQSPLANKPDASQTLELVVLDRLSSLFPVFLLFLLSHLLFVE